MARKPARKAKSKKQAAKRAAPPHQQKRQPAKRKRASTQKRRSTLSKAKRPKTATAKTSRTGPPKKSRAGLSTRRKAGGTGRESTLSQTPATGRTVTGRTNPMPTKRSTGTAAGAGDGRRVPGLERERKQLREVEESLQTPPSSLNMDRHGSAARSGRAALRHAKKEHTETNPAMAGGAVDADWEDPYAVGDEAPRGDNPPPDQDVLDGIGAALCVA